MKKIGSMQTLAVTPVGALGTEIGQLKSSARQWLAMSSPACSLGPVVVNIEHKT